MKLVVGTDSTWSLRVWLCAQIAEISTEIEVINLSDEEEVTDLKSYSPSGLVPLLLDESLVLHDSLAICEYLNERSDGSLLPQDAKERAIARSYIAELHSGFFQLRSQCPFTLDLPPPADLTDKILFKEIQRVESIFSKARGEFMFEQAGMVDAFYAILAFRLASYDIKLSGRAGEYQNALLEWSLLKDSVTLATAWKTHKRA